MIKKIISIILIVLTINIITGIVSSIETIDEWKNDDIGRISIDLSNDTMIEFQSSNAKIGTLKNNAINSGYNINDVEEIYVNSYEYYFYRNKIPQSIKIKSELEIRIENLEAKQLILENEILNLKK